MALWNWLVGWLPRGSSGLFSPEGSRGLASISLSLVCLAIAVRAVFLLRSRQNDAMPSRKKFPGPAMKNVAAVALAGGLAIFFFPQYLPAVPEAWQEQGLYRPPPGSVLVGGAVQSATRDERVRSLSTLAAAVAGTFPNRKPPLSRDGITGVLAELWCVPGQGGPNYVFLQVSEAAGNSILLAEPFLIDGEQLAWSARQGVHQISETERDAIAAQFGGPR